MELKDIQKRIEQGIPGATVQLGGDGCNCEAVVISDEFADKSLVARQKMVMNTVADLLKSGELHALSIKTYTRVEWQKNGT